MSEDSSVETVEMTGVLGETIQAKLLDWAFDTLGDDEERAKVVLDVGFIKFTRGEAIVGIWSGLLCFSAREIYQYACEP